MPVRPILELDISGDIGSPKPQVMSGDRCDCCALHTSQLWQGARAGRSESHVVCTLCYLNGHLDSPTAAHGRLAYLPGLEIADAIHLQRRSLLAILGGDKEQRKQGERVWKWMNRHSREVEVAWGSARAGEFAEAMKRLPPVKRTQLQARLTGCVLMIPADMFDDLSLLLPEAKTVKSALSSHSWATYTRSDLYV
ncbi:conjugal transfer protein TraT [Pseudomonas cichorii]|nr:conjugal transfer protein TraT [Pseudomonas cichorii]